MNRSFQECINFIKFHLNYEYRNLYDANNIILGYSLFYQPKDNLIFEKEARFIIYRESEKFSWKYLVNSKKVNVMLLKSLNKME